MTSHVHDLSCLPCCNLLCCGFTCEDYPPAIQLALNVISGNEYCDNLVATTQLDFSGNCETETWEWSGTIASGVAGTLRCNGGTWEFQSECDPLNWHAVSVLSCDPFHAQGTADFTNFFGFCCEGEVELEFTV